MIRSIDNLFDLADELGIDYAYDDLHNKQHPNLDGYADASKRLIVMDKSLLEKPRHHKCVLAEEIGHILFPPRPGHVAYHTTEVK